MLVDAITKTQNRLLIISPWIRHHVVNNSFISCLEALLRNGVDVYIGYGLAEDGHANNKNPITHPARTELEKLEKRFDNFKWKFIGNTHRKILVSDNRYAVITSFNWLSFKGDPKEKARDEAGFLISDIEQVEAIFQDNLNLIKVGYDHPPVSNKAAQPLKGQKPRQFSK